MNAPGVGGGRRHQVQGYLVSWPLADAHARLFLEWAAGSDEIAALMWLSG